MNKIEKEVLKNMGRDYKEINNTLNELKGYNVLKKEYKHALNTIAKLQSKIELLSKGNKKLNREKLLKDLYGN